MTRIVNYISLYFFFLKSHNDQTLFIDREYKSENVSHPNMFLIVYMQILNMTH